MLIHKTEGELLLSDLAENSRFFQLIRKDPGYLRGIMVKDRLPGEQQDHGIRKEVFMQGIRSGAQDTFGAVPFNGTADCFRCDHAHRGIHHIFIPEID